MKIGEKIKNAREDNKLTQTQAAENLLVFRQTISNWENGKSLPDIVSVIRMSELYNVSLDDLLKGDKAMMEKIENDEELRKNEMKIMKYAWICISIGVIVLTLNNIFEGNIILEFLSTSVPWIFLAITFLMWFLSLAKKSSYNMK